MQNLVKLRSLVSSKKGKKPSSLIEEAREGFSPYILIDQMEGRAIKYYTNDNCPKATKNDILLVWDGSIGKNATNIEGVIGSTIVCLTPKEEVIKEYIHYFIQYSKPTILAHPKGTGLAHINPDIFWNLEIPLFSKDIQHIIVSEIEKQFSRLDDGLSSLLKIRQNLKSYRASILKSAVEGRLTEEWREEQKDIETASVLLAHILEERKRKFLSENPEKKYKELEGLKLEDFADMDLPKEWQIGTVETICDKIIDCPHSTPKFEPKGFNCIDTNSIKPGKIVHEKIRFVSKETYDYRIQRMKPEAGDVLFSREGALLGIATIVPEGIDFCLGQRIMIFRMPNGFSGQYFEYIFNSGFIKNQYKNKVMGTAAPHLNIADIRKFILPLPPLAEQQKIVEEVEYRLSIVDELEQAIDAGIKKAENLKQAILKKAFSGELV